MRKTIILALSLFLAVLMGGVGDSFAQGTNCSEDSLSKNNKGKYLTTLSGRLFETLAGDYIDAMLWLPVSSLMICGPRHLSHKGKRYSIYKVINTDDGEAVDAFLVNGGKSSGAYQGDCYEATIRKPSPFMGNSDEIFVLSDGSIWEVKYEYSYMYAYHPTVIACPNRGYVIVNGKKLNATIVKR
jgi:hypothetical protein